MYEGAVKFSLVMNTEVGSDDGALFPRTQQFLQRDDSVEDPTFGASGIITSFTIHSSPIGKVN